MGTGADAVAWLRRTRARRWRPAPVDLAAYVVGAGILAALLVSMVLDAGSARPPDAVSDRRATVVGGLVVVSSVLMAITSGARGGPLALSSATVVLVLRAPVDRGAVLRSSAVRQVVVAAVAGASLGVGLWAAVHPAARMGGRLEASALAGGALGAACAGVALLLAGLRVTPRAALPGKTAVVAWWVLDLVLETVTSPMSALASLVVGEPAAAASAYAVATAVLLAGLGVRCIGGLSVERAWRRTTSADQLRVALALNDLRTAVLVLRRRAQEAPRARPWRQIRGSWTRRRPVATRSLRGLARWPATRIARFLSMAIASGGLVTAAGRAPLLGIAACAVTYGAALDASDALAQELDHPDLRRGYPLAEDELSVRHVPVPLALMTGFGTVAGLVPAAAGGATVLAIALLAAPAVALAAMAGATLTASRTARPLVTARDYGQPPEVVVPRIALRVAAPLLPLVATVLPLLFAIRGRPRGVEAAAVVLPGALVSAGVLAYVVFRERLRSRFAAAMIP